LTAVASQVWDLDATAHQTQGTFGQAIGDPVADTNTIYKAVVTDATGATVGVDVVAMKVDTAAILVDTGTTLDAALAVVDANVDAILVDTGTTLDGRIPAALVGGRMDASVGAVAADAITAAAIAADAGTELRSIVSGTADSGTTTTMVDAARTEADTDYWKDMAILFTSGTIAGQARLITAFNPATDTITFSPATTQAVGTNTYEIISNVAAAGASAPTAAEVADAVWDEDATAHQTGGTFGQAIGDPVADTNTIFKAVVTDAAGATVGVDVVAVKADTAAILVDTGTTLDGRIPAALVGGRIDASVGAMAAATVTAAAIATDAIDADALAADAALEIVDALLARDIGSGSGAGSLDERTVRAALRFLRNKWAVAAGTLTVKKEDDATTAWTAAISTDAAAVPVIGSDPT